MDTIIIFILILVLFGCLDYCEGADMNDISRLRTKLLTNYDYNSRPIQNHKNVTKVDFYLYNHGIEFNEAKGILTLHCMPVIYWKDEHMTWDPWEYGNLSEVRFHPTEVWQPDLTVLNSFYASEIDHFANTLIVVYDNTEVYWVPPAKFEVGCEPDYLRWPYDTQQCFIVLASWGHDGTEIQLTVNENHTMMDEDKLWNSPLENREWKLVHNYIQKRVFFYPSMPDIPHYDIIIGLTIERRSSSHTAAITVVALGIAAALLISFWLDPFANERVPVILIALLLNAFYLNLLHYSIPNNGKIVPLAVCFFRDSLMMVAVALVWTVILRYVVKAKRTSPVPLPDFIQTFLESIVAKILCLNSRPTLTKSNNANQTTEGFDDNDELVKQENPYQEDWAWLAYLLDRVAFLIYFIVYAVFIIMFY